MKLFLFDIDGTLVWTRGAGRAAMLDALERFFPPDGAFHERVRERMDKHVFGGKTDWLTLAELLGGEGYTVDTIGQLIGDFDRMMGDSMERVISGYDVQPCTGGLMCVQQLKARPDVRLALVTGNVRSSAPIKLRAAGYDPADFPVGAYGDEALERDHLPPLAHSRAIHYYDHRFQAEDVLVVGDTLADIQCAKAAGFPVAVVCTGFEKRELLEAAQPDYLLDNLTQLIPAVFS
ncbi:MAG: HAD hydrolase-like protein [Anaerolineae bacterium]